MINVGRLRRFGQAETEPAQHGLCCPCMQAAPLSSSDPARQPAVHCISCCDWQSLCWMPGSQLLPRPVQIIPRRSWAADSPCSLSLCQEAEGALPSVLQLQAVLPHTSLQGGQGGLVPPAGHLVQGVPPPAGGHITYPSAAVERIPLRAAGRAVASMPTSSGMRLV